VSDRRIVDRAPLVAEAVVAADVAEVAVEEAAAVATTDGGTVDMAATAVAAEVVAENIGCKRSTSRGLRPRLFLIEGKDCNCRAK
jgi:hypothetical protein